MFITRMRAVRQRMATLGHRAPEKHSMVVCYLAIHNLSNLLELGHQTERIRTQFGALLAASLVASLLPRLLNTTATRRATRKNFAVFSTASAPDRSRTCDLRFRKVHTTRIEATHKTAKHLALLPTVHLLNDRSSDSSPHCCLARFEFPT